MDASKTLVSPALDLSDSPSKRSRLPEMLRDWCDQMRRHGFSAVLVTIPDPADPSMKRRKVAGAFPPAVLEALDEWDAAGVPVTQRMGRTTDPEFASSQLDAQGFRSWACCRTLMPLGVGLEVFMLSEQQELPKAAVSEAAWDTGQIAGALWRAAADVVLPITERERTCLHSAFQGRTAEQTATDLGIAPATVTYHLNNVMKKLSAKGKMNAAMRALHLGCLWKAH